MKKCLKKIKSPLTKLSFFPVANFYMKNPGYFSSQQKEKYIYRSLHYILKLR